MAAAVTTPTSVEASVALCGAPARQRNGEPCQQPAGWGTSHVGYGRCRSHGGASWTGEVNGERLKWRDRASYAEPLPTDPAEALAAELDRSNGAVAYLQDRIAEAEGGLLHQYRDERDRLTRVARTCIEAGVLQRQTALAEAQGVAVAALIQGVLGLEPAQLQQANALVHRGLLELSEGA